MARVVIISVGTVEDSTDDGLNIAVYDVPSLSDFSPVVQEGILHRLVDELAVRDHVTVVNEGHSENVPFDDDLQILVTIKKSDVVAVAEHLMIDVELGVSVDEVVPQIAEIMIGASKIFTDASPVPDVPDPDQHIVPVVEDSASVSDPFVSTGEEGNTTVVQDVLDVVLSVYERNRTIGDVRGTLDNMSTPTETRTSSAVIKTDEGVIGEDP